MLFHCYAYTDVFAEYAEHESDRCKRQASEQGELTLDESQSMNNISPPQQFERKRKKHITDVFNHSFIYVLAMVYFQSPAPHACDAPILQSTSTHKKAQGAWAASPTHCLTNASVE